MNGCVSSPNKESAPKGTVNVGNQVPDPLVFKTFTPAEGSLWNNNGKDQLYADVTAMRIGDTVTVDIVENTSSKLDANTQASRNSSIDAGVSQMAGYMRALEEANKRLNKNNEGDLNNILFKASMQNAFDGKASSDRSGQVTASIGAVVTRVLPNGNLVLHGRREMKVNNEIQYISVSGIARPRDIDRDNRIKSIFLADSRIEYYGKGVLADKQRPGWGTRILDFVWPF
jgi:flagellar L-ring protein precursor FlgH